MRVSLNRPRRLPAVLGLTAAALLALPTAAAADPALVACDDLLVTIAPNGTTGDAYAAAVTAQALVADQPGWESVTWQVADATDLTDVLVVGIDGATRSLGAVRAGTADAVLALGFCGTTGPVDTGQGEGSAPAAEDTTSTTDESTTDAQATAEPAQESATTSTASEPGDSTADVEVAPQTVADDDTSADTSADDEGTDDTHDRDPGIGGMVPLGPTAGPYYDHARIAQALTSTPASTSELVPPGVMLLAASSDVVGAAPVPSSSPQGHGDGLGAAGLGLLAGSLVGLGMLGARRGLERLGRRRGPGLEVLA